MSDEDRPVDHPVRDVTAKNLTEALRSKVSHSLRLTVRAKKKRSDFGNVELPLSKAVTNEEVLIRPNPMRTGPTLRYSDYEGETIRAAERDRDSVNLNPGKARFGQIQKKVLNPARLLVNIRDRLRRQGGRLSLSILFDTEDQVSATRVGECRRIGQELVLRFIRPRSR